MMMSEEKAEESMCLRLECAYLRGERETDRIGDLEMLRPGGEGRLPLRAGLTDLEGDLETDLQSKHGQNGSSKCNPGMFD